ncbi:ribbon-helix-helix domain-containing protein [Mangrovimonas sp. YM274]|uniref:ribbon-helix-helix domain-containing protein n=1 Tax=Mangrovimonas sp. YM274 TaxID=3070660 RepID=UPI0027DDEC3E|nr:ribbon-helix-helix domain-containing protein [Mangrovimonas sp. YM274]WMI70256.1 ribbon-helix-helix domain-containing protein [Mangrovimonas sp. YM274]
MKKESITIRVSEELNQDLEIYAMLHEKPKSEIIREGIENLLGTNVTQELKNDTIVKIENRPNLNLVQSLSFTELIFWIYRKREDPEINEGTEFYIQHIKLLRKMNNHPLFTPEILIEFNKVLAELETYVWGEEWYDSDFSFPKNNPGGFDYEKLAYFMHTIRYDEDNNRVVEID